MVAYSSSRATTPDLRYPGPDDISTSLASALDLEALGFPPPPPLHLLATISSHLFNEYPSPTNQSLSLSPDCRHSESPQHEESLSAFTFGRPSPSPSYHIQSPSLETLYTLVLLHIDTPLSSPPSPANSLPPLPTEEEDGHSDKENRPPTPLPPLLVDPYAPLPCCLTHHRHHPHPYLFKRDNDNTKTVKNLLTVLSSRDGGLGSTQPAATEDKVTDKRAEETRSD